MTLSRFNGGVETVLDQRLLLMSPLWNERWRLIAGTADNPRRFQLFRGGAKLIDYKEAGTSSAMGANFRYAGFGMEAGTGLLRQKIPPAVNSWAMGDNIAIKQSGHLSLTNFGDQEAYPDYVVYGPGTFTFGDGPGVEPTVKFGPLYDDQIALIKTHPGNRAVYDISHEENPQDLPAFQEFIKRLLALAFNKNTPPLINWFKSAFGVSPGQGNMYSLLEGRFSKPVPPRPVAGLPETSKIAVTIEGGNAFSKVVAALTPMRRWPE